MLENITMDSDITTIIPTRNRVNFLEKSILSVLNQKNIINNKIIICDNASEDATSKLIKTFQSKYSNIEYYKHDKNIGLYENFSFGMTKVKTQYFNLLSDDDQLVSNFLYNSLEIFKKNQNVDVVLSDTIVINNKKIIVAGPFKKYTTGFINNKEATLKMAQYLIPRTWTGMVFKKKVDYDYNINPEYGPMADGLWLIDILSNNNIYCLKDIGGILFTHDHSISKKINIIDKKQITGFKLFKDKFDKNNKFSKDQKNIIFTNLKPRVDDIIFKQFMSCILSNNKDGIDKILEFLEYFKYYKLYKKYSLLLRIFNFFYFLKTILRLINQLRKLIQNIYTINKTKKYKDLLENIY